MAIQKTVEFKGITVTDAYIKIAWAKVYKDAITNKIVCWAKAEKKSQQIGIPFDEFEFDFEFDTSWSNPLVQSYLYLKSLPEFTGAIDC